jgi:hypothetical protein
MSKMKFRTDIKEQDIIKNQKISAFGGQESVRSDLIMNSRIAELLTSEGNNSFNHYIEWLGFARDPKLVVLSSVHHYYYDAEEMQNVRTVVNLKELNQIKEVASFLHSMFLILPSKSYFIGCFVDSKRQSGFSLKKTSGREFNNSSENVINGIVSRIPLVNTIFSFLDARTNIRLSSKSVSLLLSKNGFKVMDMTELGEMTYFCTQSQRTSEN